MYDMRKGAALALLAVGGLLAMMGVFSVPIYAFTDGGGISSESRMWAMLIFMGLGLIGMLLIAAGHRFLVYGSEAPGPMPIWVRVVYALFCALLVTLVVVTWPWTYSRDPETAWTGLVMVVAFVVGPIVVSYRRSLRSGGESTSHKEAS